MRALALLLCLLPGVAWGHSWYPTECCSGTDCRPVPRDEVFSDDQGNLWILINSRWTFIPPAVIRAQPAPDGKIHVCYSRAPNDQHPTLYCVFIPSGT